MECAATFDLAADGRHPDFTTGYLRCPACDLIASPGSVDYPITPDGRLGVGPIEVTCPFDGHRHQVTPAAFLIRDAVAVCRRPGCGATFAVPAAADELVCPHCHLHQQGSAPEADPQRRDQIRRVRADHARAVRAQLGRP